MTRQGGASRGVAMGGVFTALSVALLHLASLSPTGRLGITAAAGLMPMLAVVLHGRGLGYLCWMASSVLALLLVADKGMVLLYIVFFGVYPVFKSKLEQIPLRSLEWICKVLVFEGIFLAIWFAGNELMRGVVPAQLAEALWCLPLVGAVIFIVYDLGLTQIIGKLNRSLGGGRRRK